MRHDGRADLNECDPGGYLMSPTLSGNKNTWSTCSNKYLKKFLRFFQNSLLTIIVLIENYYYDDYAATNTCNNLSGFFKTFYSQSIIHPN